MRTRAVVGTVLLALVTALVGCAGPAGDAETPPDPLAAFADPVAPITSIAATPIGTTPVLLGEVAVAYVSTPELPIALAGFDARSGEQRWIHAASWLDAPSSDHLAPIVLGQGDDRRIVSIAPSEQRTDVRVTPIRLIDPRTGEARIISRDYAVSRVWDCTSHGACISGRFMDAGDAKLRVLDADGAFADLTEIAPDVLKWTPIRGDLFFTTDRGGGRGLARIARDGLLWQIPLAESGLEDIADNLGYRGVRYPSDDVILVNRWAESDDSEPHRLSDVDARVMAFDAHTGALLWRRDGVTPCGASSWTVVCSGGIEAAPRHGASPGLRVGDVVLEQLDPRTGETTRSATVEALGGWTNGWGGEILSSADLMAHTSGGRLQALDMTEWRFLPFGLGHRAACTAEISYEVDPDGVPGGSLTRVDGGLAVGGCGVDGRSEDPTAFSRAAVDAAAAGQARGYDLDGFAGRRDAGAGPELRAMQTASAILVYEL